MLLHPVQRQGYGGFLDTTRTMKLYFDLTQFVGPFSDQTNKNNMNTAAQSMGNSGSRRGLTKDRSTLDILEVLNEFFDKF